MADSREPAGRVDYIASLLLAVHTVAAAEAMELAWQLSTYDRNGTSGLAVLRADGSLAGPPELKRWPTMMELLADWQQAEGVLRGLELPGAPWSIPREEHHDLRYPRPARQRPGRARARAFRRLGRPGPEGEQRAAVRAQ